MELPENLADYVDLSTQEVVEFFLATIIGLISIIFIFASVMGQERILISLSAVFYSVVPTSIAIIAFLTFKVARMMYRSNSLNQKSLSGIVMALLLAVTSLNIGFVLVTLSGPTSLNGEIGMFQMSFLIVILSLALSISVISRNMTEIAHEA